MVNKEIVDYLREGIRRGFSIARLKKELLKGGFIEKDVDDAIAEYNAVAKNNKQINNQLGFNTKPKATMPIAKSTEERGQKIVEGIEGEKIGLFSKLGKAIAHPVQLFEKTQKESIWPALLYYWVISIIPLIIGGVLIYLRMNVFTGGVAFSPISDAYVTAKDYVLSSVWFAIGSWAVYLFIVGPIFAFIVAAILHLFVKLYRGQGSYGGTFKVLIYSMTPSLVFFFLGPLASIWTFVLSIFGLSVTHGFSKLRAFLALITPSIIAGIIYGIYYLIVYFVGGTAGA